MRIEVDGQHFEVPDDATSDEIDALTKPAAQAPQREPTIGERLKYAAHKTAGLLPAAGGIAGGALGGGIGGAIGFPTTGPGGIVTTAAGAGVGAGLGAAGGKSLQHFVDSSLGYENAPSIPEAIKDSANTGAQDAAFTAAGGVIVPTLAAGVGKLAPALDSIGNRFARRVLTGGATPLSVKKPISADALDTAYDAGAFKPWLTTGGAAKVVGGAREVAGDEYGRIVSEMEAAGVNGPDIPKLAGEYVQRLAQAKANSFNPSVHSTFGDVADQLGKMSDAGQSTLRLSQAENLRRSLQDDASAAYKQLAPRQLGKAKEEAASMLRQSIEDAVSAQSAAAPDEAAAFVPIKQKLSGLIEAGNAAERGATMAERRQPFSLTDMLAFTGGAAHGGSMEGAGMALLSKLARTYGPSTAAWAGKGGARLLEAAAAQPANALSQIGAEAGAATGDGSQRLSLQDVLDILRRRGSAMPAPQ